MTVSPEASDQQASRPWQHCHSLHCLCNENQCLITTPLLESAMDPPTLPLCPFPRTARRKNCNRLSHMMMGVAIIMRNYELLAFLPIIAVAIN